MTGYTPLSPEERLPLPWRERVGVRGKSNVRPY
jgi:hypothetical protein